MMDRSAQQKRPGETKTRIEKLSQALVERGNQAERGGGQAGEDQETSWRPINRGGKQGSSEKLGDRRVTGGAVGAKESYFKTEET